MKKNAEPKKSKNSKKKDSEKSGFSLFFASCGKYIKTQYPFLIIFFLGLVAISFINFFKISTAETVASFAIEDFEIGQISDRTIIADNSLPADEINPVSVQKGEKILKKGFPVTEESYEKLRKMATSKVYVDFRAFANTEIYLVLIAIMWYLLLAFLPFKHKFSVSEIILQVVFLLIIYACATLGSKLQPFSTPFSICVIIPSSLCVLLLSILYGQLTSVIFSFVVSLVVLNACSWSLEPFFFTLATTLFSCAIVRKIERRIDMIFVSLILALANVVYMMIIGVVFNEQIWEMGFVYLGVASNGFLSGLLGLGLLTPIELMMNTASVFRLMDLSDLNNPFMQNMLVQASGTYQHSLMVAQLSENACREIGANPLVARVGAYYHDIGKIDQSEYFVENQKGENIHNTINPSLSVSIIRSHVKKGVEKARQLHLPKVVVDIIAEHHGNSVISYFYNEAKEKDPTVSPEDFSYMGTPPTSRESGVVMIADTVEAACRTLENKSVPSLEKFIDKLVQGKIDHKQLDNCNLTFSDLAKIKQAFVQILAGYYHSRIEYPDEKKEEDKPAEVEKQPEKQAEKTATSAEQKTATKSPTGETKIVEQKTAAKSPTGESKVVEQKTSESKKGKGK